MPNNSRPPETRAVVAARWAMSKVGRIGTCSTLVRSSIGGAAYREHQLAGGGPHLAFQPVHHGVGIAFEELQQLVHQLAAQQAHDIITTFAQLVLSSTPKVAAFTGLRR